MQGRVIFIALLLLAVVKGNYNYNHNHKRRYNINKNINSNYNTINRWGYDRKPRVMGRTLPMKALTPSERKVQQKILSYHNHFRSSVKPVAANMLLMRWHSGSAAAAQRWADSCQKLVHDSPSGRYINNFGTCGQNIFISNQKVPWYFAIETWFLEKNLFFYGFANNSLESVGHYTQLVWASSHKVGCGISKCNNNNKVYYNYICNYCPAGNYPNQLGRPYKKGRVCSSCQNNCQGRLCTNSCPWVDLWANCGDLYDTWPQWLCKSPGNLERRQNCKATCFCKNRIK